MNCTEDLITPTGTDAGVEMAGVAVGKVEFQWAFSFDKYLQRGSNRS